MADPTQPQQPTPEQLKTAEELNKMNVAELKGLKEKLEALKDINDEQVKQLKIVREILAVKEAEEQFLVESIKARKQALEESQKELDIIREKIELEKDNKKKKELLREYDIAKLGHLREELRHLKLIGQENTEAYKTAQKAYQDQLQKVKAQKEEIENLEKINNITSKIAGDYGDQVKSLFTTEGILNGIGSTFKSILETQQNLVRETGRNLLGYEAVFRSISFGTTGLAAMGVGVDDLGKAYGGLYTNFSDFSELSGEIQSNLAKSSAKMENLGVSTSLTAKNINELSKGLRFTAEEANTKLNQIAGSAIKAGIAPAKALQDLSSALPQLSANGKQAVDVFFALEKQSKSLGMEVGDLLGIVGQAFDTFEGAAEKAGKLNALLGGDYLNSVEMLNATESERVEIMKRAFAQSGQSFETMDRFQQKSIAMSLGFKSAAEASKFFSNSSAENALALENEAKAQAELERAQLAAAPVTKQLTAIFSQLAVVIKPLVDLLGFLTTGLAALGPFAVPVLMLLAGTFKVFGSTISMVFGTLKEKVTGFFSGLLKSSEKAPKAGENVSGMLNKIGEAGEKSGKGLVQVGLAMLAFGAGVGLAALGLAQLVQTFKGLTGNEALAAFGSIVAIMIGFTAAVFLLGKIAIPASAEIAPLALVLLAIGASVFLAAYGMSMLVESFKGLGSSAEAVATSITAIMLGMVGLGIVVLLMMKTLPATTIAVVALGVALIGLGLVLYLTGSIWADFADNLSKAGSGLVGFGEGMKALADLKVDNLMAVKDVLKEISDVLEKMPKDIKVQVQGIYGYGVAAGAGMATGKSIAQPVQAVASSVIPAAVARQQNFNDAIGRSAAPEASGGIGAKASSENIGRTEVIIKIDDATQLRGYVLGPLASRILTGGG